MILTIRHQILRICGFGFTTKVRTAGRSSESRAGGPPFTPSEDLAFKGAAISPGAVFALPVIVHSVSGNVPLRTLCPSRKGCGTYRVKSNCKSNNQPQC